VPVHFERLCFLLISAFLHIDMDMDIDIDTEEKRLIRRTRCDVICSQLLFDRLKSDERTCVHICNIYTRPSVTGISAVITDMAHHVLHKRELHSIMIFGLSTALGNDTRFRSRHSNRSQH